MIAGRYIHSKYPLAIHFISVLAEGGNLMTLKQGFELTGHCISVYNYT